MTSSSRFGSSRARACYLHGGCFTSQMCDRNYHDALHCCHSNACSVSSQAICRPKPPAVLADSYPMAEYKKTQAYNVDKWCAAHQHVAQQRQQLVAISPQNLECRKTASYKLLSDHVQVEPLDVIQASAGRLQVFCFCIWGHSGSYRGSPPHLLLPTLALGPGRRCGVVPGKAHQLVSPQ